MYRNLPVDQIDRNPDQPRKHFDEAKLQELADSIAANGLLEPVIVRKVNDRFLLVAGERRWRASKIAGAASIPALVKKLDEVEAFVLSVAENVNRDDMTVMEEARAYDQLRRYGKGTDEIAKVFGKRPDVVDGRLLLLDLEPHIQKSVEDGTMGALLAWHIAKLQPGNQRVVNQRWSRGEIDTPSAIEFAKALLVAESEVGFFDLVEPTEEERIEHTKKARATANRIDQIERLSGLLGELASADPDDLAAALGNDVERHLASIERIGRQVTRARNNLRTARAVAEARTLTVTV